MITRIFMVVLVATLGVYLPCHVDCGRWLSLSERWASRLMADWDTWQPLPSDAHSLSLNVEGLTERTHLLECPPTEDDRPILNVIATASQRDSRRSKGFAARALRFKHDESPECDEGIHGSEWTVFSSCEHVELAMVIGLCRVAESTLVGPVSEPSKSAQALPAAASTVEPIPIDVQTIAASTRPLSESQPLERGAGPEIVTIPPLPDIVFAAPDRELRQPADCAGLHELGAESIAANRHPLTATPGASGDNSPTGLDLGVYCKDFSPAGAESDHSSSEAPDVVFHPDERPDSVPVELDTECEPRIGYEDSTTSGGTLRLQHEFEMVSDLPISGSGSFALSGVTASPADDRHPEVESHGSAIRPKCPEEDGLQASEMDEAVRLTRGAVTAWLQILTRPRLLTVTTR